MNTDHMATLSLDDMLESDAEYWRGIPEHSISLVPTPGAMQPTEYIRNKWANDAQRGGIDTVEVRVASGRDFVAVHLSWRDDSADFRIESAEQFVDAAAVMVASHANAPLMTMGNSDMPVDIWYWRANNTDDAASQVIAAGYGTSLNLPGSRVRARGRWSNGRWRVVLARPRHVIGHSALADLRADAPIFLAFAVWRGSASERAGIKSFSPMWLQVDPGKADNG